MYSIKSQLGCEICQTLLDEVPFVHKLSFNIKSDIETKNISKINYCILDEIQYMLT